MVVSEMTRTEKFRLGIRSVCPICKEKITEDDTCEYMKLRRGKNLAYIFFHTKCLVSQLSDKERS